MQDDDGWIKHDGGPCPVPLDSRPAVKWSNGAVCRSGTARIWAGCEGQMTDLWCCSDPRNRIVAYKPEPTP